METHLRRRTISAAVQAVLSTTILFGSANVATSQEPSGAIGQDQVATSRDARISGANVTFAIDNDLFAREKEDRDYTGGINITITRRQGRVSPVGRFLRSRATFVDRDIENFAPKNETVQIGLLVFTPDDIESSSPLRDDRPYANLLFLKSTLHWLSRSQDILLQSDLTIGLLGTEIAREAQSAIHRRSGSAAPQGYSHQISDGGELTFQYEFSRHVLLSASNRGRFQSDLKLSLSGSFGFLTDASVGIDYRWGQVASPWWQSVSNYANYAARPSPSTRLGSSRDLYAFAGIRFTARAYNVFLQGQLRDSEVTYGSSALHQILSEAWIGLAMDFDRFRLTYALRFQSPEIRRGPAARTLKWASVSIERRFQ